MGSGRKSKTHRWRSGASTKLYVWRSTCSSGQGIQFAVVRKSNRVADTSLVLGEVPVLEVLPVRVSAKLQTLKWRVGFEPRPAHQDQNWYSAGVMPFARKYISAEAR